MARLSSNDLLALLDLVRQTYAVRDAQALRRHVAVSVRRLIGADNSGYSEVDPSRQLSVEIMDPGDLQTAESVSVFNRFMHEHPLIAHYARTRDGRAYKVSDFVSRADLERLAIYNEYARPYFGTEHQMAIAVSAGPSHVVGVTLARSRRDFSERERLILNLLRPHIVQALRSVDALAQLERQVADLNRAVDAQGVGFVIADGSGGTRAMTPRARLWIRHYFGRSRPSERLPPEISGWLAAQQAACTDQGDAPPVRQPLIVTRAKRQLVIRCLDEADGHLLLLEEQAQGATPDSLRRLGLTTREAEVLTWVAEGKTNEETAAIVGARPRTVDKHLERIYRKLNVDNRTAAAMLVHELPK